MTDVKVCIDASLALLWLLPSTLKKKAEKILIEWTKTDVHLISAPLFDAEITSVLREQVYHRRMLSSEAEEAFRLYKALGVRPVFWEGMQEAAWSLAKRFNRPRTYDMQYLAVAEREDCELWTADQRLFHAIGRQMKRVRSIL